MDDQITPEDLSMGLAMTDILNGLSQIVDRPDQWDGWTLANLIRASRTLDRLIPMVAEFVGTVPDDGRLSR